jgi:hypothetical protein
MPLTARSWFSVYIPPNHSARGRSSACRAASIGLGLLCAYATHAHGYGGSRLRFLSLRVLVRTAGCLLRKFGSPHENVACDRKAVEHAFLSFFGVVRILCAAPPLVLLPHEGWCWKQRSGRNRSGEALALAFASGFQPISGLIQSQESRGNSNRKNDPFAQRPHHAPTFPPTPLILAF